jgi:chromosome segregation ATPase
MTKPESTNGKITLEELAAMVQRSLAEQYTRKEADSKFESLRQEMQKGFDEVRKAMHKGFDGVNARMDKGFEESKQRDAFLQKQIDNITGDVTDIKKVVKRLPTQKDFLALKKRVYVLEQSVGSTT